MTISAKIIADSVASTTGVRITTFELEYPRFIHSELMTHRVFSRNASSSRAIPIANAITLVLDHMASPVHWGKHQPGMQAKEQNEEWVALPLEYARFFEKGSYKKSDGAIYATREDAWFVAGIVAAEIAEAFREAGYHKQIVNRILETYSHIKVVVTATDFNNWFWLRDHEDAQPEIAELARKMFDTRTESDPFWLSPGQWHTPYFKEGRWVSEYVDGSMSEALAISASCCAQVSYRKNDESLEKALDLFRRLVEMEPVHASPFEHQATPMEHVEVKNWAERTASWLLNKFGEREWNLVAFGPGVTAYGADGVYRSGNFRGWVQHRQLISGNAKPG